jgi:hypothetical protein
MAPKRRPLLQDIEKKVKVSRLRKPQMISLWHCVCQLMEQEEICINQLPS